MVLEKLGGSLKETLSKIARSVFVDEKLINELIKDIQRALLQSDVNVSLVFELTKKIKERALKEKTPTGLTKKEQLVNIVYDELVNFLGEERREIKIEKRPAKIFLVGLYGSGKTTTAGKLAKYYKKKGYKTAVVQTDTWRPAAYEQLKQLAKSVGVDFYGIRDSKDPVKIYSSFEREFEKYDLLIIDSAGRDSLSEELIEELNNLNSAVSADERLLVISGDIGQAAKEQAEAFHKSCSITGVIITKLDGTAKGGGALSACAVTGAKVLFIGTGEKIDELEKFDPKRFVSRLLGMGDLETLLEKAKEVVTEEEAKDMSEKFLKGEFNLVDLYSQMEAMKKMGSLKKLVGMIPGFSQLKLPKEMLDVQEDKLKIWKFAMDSMTKKELEEPDSIDSSRMERIAKGSGLNMSNVRELLKQYRQSKKMVKMFKGQNLNKVMKRFGGKMPMM